MRKVFIHHHLGLGDHLMCNAIVRHYARENDQVLLLVFTKYYKVIKYMFRDLNNIVLLPLDNEEYHAQFQAVNTYRMVHPDANYIKIGHEYLYNTELPADKAFYEQVGLSWDARYSDFYIERDPVGEQEVFDHYNPDHKPFVFIHQDSSRPRLTLDKSHIKNKDLHVVEIDFDPKEKKRFNFFHHMKLMEEAEESHYVDSSFKCLADSFIFDKPNMYFHKIENIKNSTSVRDHWNVIAYN